MESSEAGLSQSCGDPRNHHIFNKTYVSPENTKMFIFHCIFIALLLKILLAYAIFFLMKGGGRLSHKANHRKFHKIVDINFVLCRQIGPFTFMRSEII